MIDIDAWEERAAIMEFDAGMSRFQAETEAAKAQGATRWEVIDAIRKRDIAKARDNREAAIRNGAGALPTVQRSTEKQG